MAIAHKRLIDIRSSRVRNLVRGILSNTSITQAKRSLEHLRTEAALSEISSAYQVLLDGPETQALLPVSFPNDLNAVRSAPLLREVSLEKEAVCLGARLKKHEARITSAISEMNNINRAILRLNKNINSLFINFAQSYGLSNWLLRKYLSFAHLNSLSGRNEAFPEFINDNFYNPKRQIVAIAFEDTIDAEREYIKTRRTILKLLADGRFRTSTAALLYDILSPTHVNSPSESLTLQAYARWSLVDGMQYASRLQARYAEAGRSQDLTAIRRAIPESIQGHWDRTFSQLDLDSFKSRFSTEPSMTEFRFFRHAPAWSEFADIEQYKNRVESVAKDRLDGRRPPTSATPKYFIDINEPSELLPKSAGRSFSLKKIKATSCGSFHRTLALIHVFSRTQKALNFTRSEALQLLDTTMEVADLFSSNEITVLFPQSDDQLLNYLRHALLADSDGSRISAHKFRRVTQAVIIEEFNRNIVSFLEYLYLNYPVVGTHFLNKCNEYFLTELYLLFKRPEEVTNAYANILEWQGEQLNDPDATLRAKSYRLNMRLNRIRGNIDDSRIYVDPLRFQDWVRENYGSALRELAGMTANIADDTTAQAEVSNPVSRMESPKIQFIAVLSACYREFVTNKYFGIDSYIARRIRHGTLYGQLISEFEPTMREAVEHLKPTCPRFVEQLEIWFERLKVSVRTLVDEHLQVRSKSKDRGLINALTTTKDKAGAFQRMRDEVLQSFEHTRHVSQSIALIYEYSWILIELDLKLARRFIAGMKDDFKIRYESYDKYVQDGRELEVKDSIRQINTALQDRFDRVIAWLTRPGSATPNTDVGHLFQAVVLEVKDRYPGFAPKFSFHGETSFEIIGHRFHYFYDMLYIIVDNAAQHGERTGPLSFQVETARPTADEVDVFMRVRSTLRAGSEETARTKIEEAMNADIGDAMVQHQGTGIRKARGIFQIVDEITEFSSAYPDNNVQFTVGIKLKST